PPSPARRDPRSPAPPGIPKPRTKWRSLIWPFGVIDARITFSLPVSVCVCVLVRAFLFVFFRPFCFCFGLSFSDRVCQQPGLSLWVPFQNAATAVTNLYKESVDTHQRSFDIGIQIGYQRRNKDVLAWVKKRRRTIRREDLISFLCGKVPPPRNSRAPPRLTVVSPNRATSTETSSSVETDLQPFREAIALHGLSGAMASISVRSSTPGSPTHVSSGSNASRRRNGLHDVDLNTFISEEMALHLDNGGTRKRTSAQCGDVITDSPTHKRNRMI
uniref:HUWE1 associated protein modifying stress responses n=2 Tax=Urocitellus parryii TaxID=9999 RepID=A0A8D2I2V7_UROPR